MQHNYWKLHAAETVLHHKAGGGATALRSTAPQLETSLAQQQRPSTAEKLRKLEKKKTRYIVKKRRAHGSVVINGGFLLWSFALGLFYHGLSYPRNCLHFTIIYLSCNGVWASRVHYSLKEVLPYTMGVSSIIISLESSYDGLTCE